MAPSNAAKPVPEFSGNRPLGIDSFAALDVQQIKDKSKRTQARFDPSTITCSSMREDELRLATDSDLDRLIVKIIAAKHFNREGLDDDADEILRDCWRMFRVAVTPLRNELRRLRAGGR